MLFWYTPQMSITISITISKGFGILQWKMTEIPSQLTACCGKGLFSFQGEFSSARYVQNSIYLLLSNSVSPQLFPTDSLATKKTIFHSNASNYNDQLNRYLWTTDFHKEVQQLFMYKVICKKRFLVCVLRMNPEHLLQNFVCITGNIWHQDLCFTPHRDLLLLLKKTVKGSPHGNLNRN